MLHVHEDSPEAARPTERPIAAYDEHPGLPQNPFKKAKVDQPEKNYEEHGPSQGKTELSKFGDFHLESQRNTMTATRTNGSTGTPSTAWSPNNRPLPSSLPGFGVAASMIRGKSTPRHKKPRKRQSRAKTRPDPHIEPGFIIRLLVVDEARNPSRPVPGTCDVVQDGQLHPEMPHVVIKDRFCIVVSVSDKRFSAVPIYTYAKKGLKDRRDEWEQHVSAQDHIAFPVDGGTFERQGNHSPLLTVRKMEGVKDLSSQAVARLDERFTFLRDKEFEEWGSLATESYRWLAEQWRGSVGAQNEDRPPMSTPTKNTSPSSKASSSNALTESTPDGHVPSTPTDDTSVTGESPTRLAEKSSTNGVSSRAVEQPEIFEPTRLTQEKYEDLEKKLALAPK